MKLILSLLCALLLAGSVHADCVLRQSDTAELPLGPFVDATDGVTAETALTISQADVRLKKCTAAGDCAAWAQVNESTAAAHEENGWYEKDLDTTDTNTVGILQIAVHESGALPVFKTCTVVEEAVYDRDYAGSATGIVGTAQTGDAFARLGAPAGASIAADLVVLDNFVDDLESRVGTPANLGGGATVAANLSDIEAQTDDIGAAGAGLTALATQASVNTIDDFVDTEVAAILDDTGTSGVVVAETTSNCREVLGCDTQGTLSGTHSSTTADLGTNAPANDIAGMTLVVPSRNFSRAISSYNTSTGVATFDTTGVTLANADQYYVHATAPASGGGSAPTVSQIVAGVWDEPVTGNTTAGTFGAAVNDVLTDTGTTLDDLVDDLESRLGTPSNLGGGATVAANLSDIEGQTDDIGVAGAGLTAADDSVMTRLGAPVGASLSADIAGVESGIAWNSAWDAEVQSEAADAINADTGDTFTAVPWNAAWDAEAQSEAADALTAYDPPTQAELTAALAALNDLSIADLQGMVIEDQGGGVSMACALSVMLSILAGDVATAANTSTFEDPSGTETRASSSQPSAGNRTVTITCPTL
jgi:hypothetical protein